MATLLLVDDEPVLLSAMTRILNSDGYEVITATSGSQALAVLSDAGSDLPDLIVTDVLMEDGDGIQLFTSARQNPAWQHIPFLFVSASAKPELEALIARSPNAVFIRKPFEIPDLLKQVARALERSAGHS